MPRTAGEMPFLDHLEELRKRILRSLLAVVACFALGLWLVDRFHLLDLLKRPIAPFLPAGQLTVLSPTEPLMIVLKLGFITGLVLASPVILWQLWAFLSPALYEKEKKTLVPALFVGLGLFLTGAALSFAFIVPQALRVLLNFQKGSFATMITFEAYFSFVMQLVLALGLSCELPLLMIILAALGIVATPLLNRIRPYAIVGSFVAGAILSPGADVLSMFMLTIPLLALYEVGVAGVWMVQRRRLKADTARAAGTALLLLCCVAMPSQGQQSPFSPTRPGQQRPPDTTARAPVRQLDSASARRLGLPSAPKRGFPTADSILDQLLDLEGYAATRYQADSATIQAIDRLVDLRGNAMTERAGSVLEAAAIRYQEGACAVVAEGEPHLFQGGQVLIGASARFDTCTERGVVTDALTNFNEGGGNWFVRGNLAVDSTRSRLYGGHAELTSCDLPIAHYHFSATQIKWISKSLIVARPATLYVRDVPIAWIPFLFQDTKPGRRSGILIPQFGFNDIVRTGRGVNRQVSNIGYYWAPNDYFDAQAQLDWFNKRYLAYGITANYKLRDRFLSGRAAYSVQRQAGGGGVSHSVDWSHSQQFNVTTTLALDVHYSTNSQLIARNSIDPLVTTQEIRSNGNLTKRFTWGQLTAGLSRRETITNGSGDMTLPTLTISPSPIDFGRNVTWSPGLSFTNTYSFKTPLAALFTPGGGGTIDTLALTGSSRASTVNLDTPLRIGGFKLPLHLDVVDRDTTGRTSAKFRIPDLSTPDPDDSVSVTQFSQGGYSTTLDWNTQIQLPILFRSTWKFTPSVGIANAIGAPFAVRNTRTGGEWVHQGKRLNLGATLSPTLFAFLPGFAGISKIRHSISPSLSYSYSPEASVPEEFARAITPAGGTPPRTSPRTQTVSLSLSQNFEGKGRQAPEDTLGTSARKFTILSIRTDPISYDFEQAKLPGRSGWTTASLGNVLSSDLVPGFSLSIRHDLWEGQVGTDTAKFKPFLQSVSTQFSITENTLHSVGALLGLAHGPAKAASTGPPEGLGTGGVPLPGSIRRNTLLQPVQSLNRGSQAFSANITLNIQRSRPIVNADGTTIPGQDNSSIGLNTHFSPTQFWGLTWATQYNTSTHSFESQQVQLSRDLHEWRAAFNFVKSPNGNFAFFFSIFLTDFPDINYKYNQSSIRP